MYALILAKKNVVVSVGRTKEECLALANHPNNVLAKVTEYDVHPKTNVIDTDKEYYYDIMFRFYICHVNHDFVYAFTKLGGFIPFHTVRFPDNRLFAYLNSEGLNLNF